MTAFILVCLMQVRKYFTIHCRVTLNNTLIDCIVFHNKLTRSGSFRELVLTGFIPYLRWKNQIGRTERWKCNNTMHMNGNQSQVQQLIQKILKAALIATSV